MEEIYLRSPCIVLTVHMMFVQIIPIISTILKTFFICGYMQETISIKLHLLLESIKVLASDFWHKENEDN